ncbi:hypothetical protein ScPMuIL_006426 [Solemya velum]
MLPGNARTNTGCDAHRGGSICHPPQDHEDQAPSHWKRRGGSRVCLQQIIPGAWRDDIQIQGQLFTIITRNMTQRSNLVLLSVLTVVLISTIASTNANFDAEGSISGSGSGDGSGSGGGSEFDDGSGSGDGSEVDGGSKFGDVSGSGDGSGSGDDYYDEDGSGATTVGVGDDEDTAGSGDGETTTAENGGSTAAGNEETTAANGATVAAGNEETTTANGGNAGAGNEETTAANGATGGAGNDETTAANDATGGAGNGETTAANGATTGAGNNAGQTTAELILEIQTCAKAAGVPADLVDNCNVGAACTSCTAEVTQYHSDVLSCAQNASIDLSQFANQCFPAQDQACSICLNGATVEGVGDDEETAGSGDGTTTTAENGATTTAENGATTTAENGGSTAAGNGETTAANGATTGAGNGGTTAAANRYPNMISEKHGTQLLTCESGAFSKYAGQTNAQLILEIQTCAKAAGVPADLVDNCNPGAACTSCAAEVTQYHSDVLTCAQSASIDLSQFANQCFPAQDQACSICLSAAHELVSFTWLTISLSALVVLVTHLKTVLEAV